MGERLQAHNAVATCPLCRLHADGPHQTCRDILADRLDLIPGLYAALATVLEPGRTATARVSGSRTPPLPARIEPLSLRGRGGIIAILATWEMDWRELRGLSADLARNGGEQLLAGDRVLARTMRFLSNHLDWAIDHHPAIGEFADEIREIIKACRTALGELETGMPIGRCPALLDSGRTCSRVLHAYPYASAIACDRCGTEWPRHRWPLLGQTIEASRNDHAA